MSAYDEEGLLLVQNLYNNLLPVLPVYFTGKIIRKGKIVQSADFKAKMFIFEEQQNASEWKGV